MLVLAGSSGRVDADRAALLAANGAVAESLRWFGGDAPSDVVWAGVRPDGSVTSHWTLGGAPLPFVPLVDDWVPGGEVPAFVGLYDASRRSSPQRVVAGGDVPSTGWARSS